jgi:hypothetical protein
MRRMSMLRTSLVFGCLLFLAACSSDKGPAEQAIKAAEDAFNAAKAEATKYVPDQAKAVEGAIKAAKDAFAKSDYTAALGAAKDLAAKAKDLASAAAAKKDELTKSWADLSGSVPKMVETIQGRVDALAKVKKLPAGLDKAKLDEAKAGLATLTQGWTEASEAFKAGSLADAIAKAKSVKEKAAGLMTALGIQA